MNKSKESRTLKVALQKSGSGSTNARVHLPISWIKEMGIDEDNRNINVSFIDGKIIIEKEGK